MYCAMYDDDGCMVVLCGMVLWWEGVGIRDMRKSRNKNYSIRLGRSPIFSGLQHQTK